MTQTSPHAAPLIANIQSLRFLAAFWVMLHHIRAPIAPFAITGPAQPIADMGFAGLDLFFVISGFIMAETTRQMPGGDMATGLRFVGVRFARIFSGWWPFFFVYWAAYSAAHTLRPEKQLLASFFLLPQSLEKYLLPVTWTLSFELYFYLCVGLLLVWSRRRAGLALTAAAFLVVALNAYWYANGMYHPDRQSEVGMLQAFFAFPLTLEFIAGFLLAEYLRDRPRPSPYPWLIGAAVFLALAFGYHSYADLYPSGLSGFFHAPERSVLLGGLGCCLVAVAVALEKRGIAPWPWLQRLGDTSYSIYLSHILMIAMAGFVLKRWFLDAAYMAPLGIGASIGATLLASWWTYRWLERPLYTLLKSGLSRPARLWQQALPNKSP